MIHEQIDGYHELTDIYAEPPVKTAGPLMLWPQFWKLFYQTDYNQLRIPEWLCRYCAFGDDGVRLIERY